MSLIRLPQNSPEKQGCSTQIQYYDFLIRLIEGRQSSPLDEERLREMNFCKYLPAQSDLAKLRLCDEAVRRIATDCRFSWLASTVASSLERHDISYTASMVCELVAQTTIYFHHRELPSESYLPRGFLQEKASLISQLRPSLTRLVSSIALEQAAPPVDAGATSLALSRPSHAQLDFTEFAEAITLIQRLSDGDVLVQADFVADDLLAWLLGHWWGPLTIKCDDQEIFEARVGAAGSHLLYLVAASDATEPCGCRAPSSRRLLISRRAPPVRTASVSRSVPRCITDDSSRESSLEPEAQQVHDCRVTSALKHMFQNIQISGNAIVHLGDSFHRSDDGPRRTRLRTVRSDPTVDRARRVRRRALAEVFRDARTGSPIRKHRRLRRGLLGLGRGIGAAMQMD